MSMRAQITVEYDGDDDSLVWMVLESTHRQLEEDGCRVVVEVTER